MVTTKVGMSKSEPERFPPCHSILSTNADHSFPPISPSSPESNDPEFEDYQRNFTLLEAAADKFLKDTRTFTDAVNSMCRVTSPFHEYVAYRSLRQHSSRPEAASRSISLSSFIRSLPSMTSSGNTLKPRTQSRTSTRITLRWRSCVRPSALNSS
jgi:hypothetical protein